MRSVLITGASGGVGRGIALACGNAGWEVWVAARREAEARAVAAEVNATPGRGRHVVCDVTDEASVADAVAEILHSGGPLHGVVHNATSGLSSVPGTLGSSSADDLQQHIAVALRGLFHLIRAAQAPLAHAGGSLVVLTSEAGFEGKQRLAAYAMVKAAQRGLVRTLAREWGPAGVRVNAVAPLAASPAMAKAFAADPSMEERVMGRIPLRRLGDAESDVGPVVEFLLSDRARFLTGQVLMADGGSCPIA